MENRDNKKAVVLVAFHNVKALGVRYLESALKARGYRVVTIFFKGFNSLHPKPVTDRELELLKERVAAVSPVMVGLSVMSSMYLDTVNAVLDAVKSMELCPVVCGGAYATMFPEKLLERGASYVVRSDGENAVCALADALATGGEVSQIPSLCRMAEGEYAAGDIGGMENDIDLYGLPAVRCDEGCYIENGELREGDPQLGALSYEVIASRGCPFTCSYCCCVNLHRLQPKDVKPIRIRSVKSVIDELIIAKRELKKLVFVHFYDEIFPNLPGWVDEFAAEYKKHINLPFTIWSHPKMIDREVLDKLVSVGLMEVIIGIQSGSDHIRRDVFHRYETREDILKAVRTVRDSGVFWASYDFMLRHPFESVEDLKQTYYLVKEFPKSYELQLHGLNFLPGTDIVPMAIEQGYFTAEEMDAVMYAPMQEQFGAYWMREGTVESRLWYEMTDLLQFGRADAKWEADPLKHEGEIDAAYAKAQKRAKLRYLYKKGRVVLKSRLMRLG